MPRLRRLSRAIALAAMALLLGAAACGLAGLRINTSPSIPLGLYRMSGMPVARGAHVLLCPAQTPAFALALQRGYLGAGFCPGGYGYLMKQVAAAGGDEVGFAMEGVRVNGRLLDASAALPMDQGGRRLPRYPQGTHILGPDQVLLMSTRRTAWDARYFGPVPLAQVEGVIVPLLTWQHR
ncbi:conjugative transfer signal peptidase TraF (plasmid) [Comamonas endophytica]|uniref:Conjugative transfer signal peptidase TraF n=2 Tax=Comamonas endophytica TaxID=2949090 RepID=A0ABY6GFR6_9BURK|nr:conjugative transfer signal peptidase TraF [Acidovorax sp. D4N7]UYG53921.1 conjugative transfer signal peptidase TraF [Acidovorax sp. 5MLIR]